VGQIARRLALEQLGPELRDHGVVNPGLQFGIWICRSSRLMGLRRSLAGRDCRLGSGAVAVRLLGLEAIVETHGPMLVPGWGGSDASSPASAAPAGSCSSHGSL